MSQTVICSGLGCPTPCPKREQCVNYVHWTLDKRSQFNACTASSNPLKHFTQIGTTPAAQQPRDQQDFFN